MSQDNLPDELVELAKEFLADEAIKDSPRQDKIDFLKEKGLTDNAIEDLLGKDHTDSELRTIHDTSETTDIARDTTASSHDEPEPTPEPTEVYVDNESRRDVASTLR